MGIRHFDANGKLGIIVELEAREFYGEVTSVAKPRDNKTDLPASHNKPKPRTEHQ